MRAANREHAFVVSHYLSASYAPRFPFMAIIRRSSAATGPGICGSKYGKAKREPVRNEVKDGMPHRGWRRSRLGVQHFSYEKTLMSIDIRVSYEKVAATYSPTWWGSTIGDGELNFSVRNGKRWILTAITATVYVLRKIT